MSFREQIKADRAKAATKQEGGVDDVVCVVSPDKKKAGGATANKTQSQPALGGVVQSPTNKVRSVQSDGVVCTDYV